MDISNTTASTAQLAPSSRIGDLGVGTCIAFAGFIVVVLSCVVGNSVLARPGWLHLVSTSCFIVMLLYLSLAKRRDPFLPPDNLVEEFDEMWIVRVVLGALCTLGSCAGAVVLLNDCSEPVRCKEITTERDRQTRLNRGRPKFLF